MLEEKEAASKTASMAVKKSECEARRGDAPLALSRRFSLDERLGAFAARGVGASAFEAHVVLQWHNKHNKAAAVAGVLHHTAVWALMVDLGAKVAVDNFDDKGKFAIFPLRKFKILDVSTKLARLFGALTLRS